MQGLMQFSPDYFNNLPYCPPVTMDIWFIGNTKAFCPRVFALAIMSLESLFTSFSNGWVFSSYKSSLHALLPPKNFSGSSVKSWDPPILLSHRMMYVFFLLTQATICVSGLTHFVGFCLSD